MRRKSHQHLGKYLVQHYMPHVPRHNTTAFLIGCVEPDSNPFTYLKGSLRCQWLRGHNYRNARRYMRHLSWRLEKKQTLRLLDYYNLGKLIHYTADAFTYAHNDTFTAKLGDHRTYEAHLQDHFLSYLARYPHVDIRFAKSIIETVSSYHREYMTLPADIQTDCHFALAACCCILVHLLAPGTFTSGVI